MRNYLCYIKSHSDYPDYEQEFQAENFSEAVKKMVEMTRWSENDIAKYIVELCPECDYPLETRTEARQGHNLEIVTECKGCGYTEVTK